ncbi:MAG: anti-sigma factor family protein [Limisphaerales bacterium]
MKPCSSNRKLIAWLAIDALDARRERVLRAHLETCDGCRRYLEQVSNVTERLIAAQSDPDVRASDSFHQRVVDALRAESSASVWETVAAPLRASRLNWRAALTVIGATAVLIAAVSLFIRRPGVAWPPSTGVQLRLAQGTKREPDPTISNYQAVANQSLEKLDELLTRQGNRNPSSSPVYTASMLPRATGWE